MEDWIRLIDEEYVSGVLRGLLALTDETGLRARIDAMFAGEKINTTEDRAVLHVALRAPRDARIEVDGGNVIPEVHAVLDRMAAFAERVRGGDWTGHTCILNCLNHWSNPFVSERRFLL